MSNIDNTQREVDDHSSDAAAHHERPAPGKNLTENSDGTWDASGAPTSQYLYGEPDGTGSAFDRYDIGADSWASMTSAPGAMDGLTGANNGYVYAAASGSALYRYDIGADSWTTLTAPPYDVHHLTTGEW